MGLEGEQLFLQRKQEADRLVLFNLFLHDTIGKALSGLPSGAGNLLRLLLFKDSGFNEFSYPPDRIADIKEQRLEVASIANQVLDKVLLQPYSTPLSLEQYLQIRETIKKYYLLTAPSLNPDQNQTVLDAEKSTGISHIGRTEAGQKVWIANEKSTMASHLLPIKELGKFEKIEADRWFKKCDGLLDHIFVAAEPFMVELLSALQTKIAKEFLKGQKLNPFQKTLLKIDPFLYGIKMLFHDDGRKISQHRVAHEVETQLVLALAGVQEHFRKEPAHPVVGREMTSSITKMEPTEENIMQLLFYFADCVAKVNSNTGKLRRPQEFDEVFQNQSRRYTVISSDDGHAKFEEIIFGKILFWLQDEERGLNFSIEELEQVYERVESGIKQRRAELGVV